MKPSRILLLVLALGSFPALSYSQCCSIATYPGKCGMSYDIDGNPAGLTCFPQGFPGGTPLSETCEEIDSDQCNAKSTTPKQMGAMCVGKKAGDDCGKVVTVWWALMNTCVDGVCTSPTPVATPVSGMNPLLGAPKQ